MAQSTIPFEQIVEKMQSGEYTWLEYIMFNSAEWRDDYAAYCIENELRVNNESAKAFADIKEREFDEALKNGRA